MVAWRSPPTRVPQQDHVVFQAKRVREARPHLGHQALRGSGLVDLDPMHLDSPQLGNPTSGKRPVHAASCQRGQQQPMAEPSRAARVRGGLQTRLGAQLECHSVELSGNKRTAEHSWIRSQADA